MYVRFWGTRGSIAAPGSSTAKYGGNTSCVEVRASDGTLIVLDCGTGARDLGLQLLRTAPQPLRIHLFIGHTHWDHIQGFPFFAPAFMAGAEVNIYAPIGFQRGLEDTMSGQMEYAYFPVKLRDLRSRIHFTELEEGFFRVGEVLVETQYLNHTAPTIAYRMSSGDTTVAYVTDHEPFWNPVGRLSAHPGDQRHIAFLRGADLVIHDAQYTADEYRSKIGWGHSTIEYATDVALAAEVGRLALFHHDPIHDDAMMERMERSASARVAGRGGSLEVFAAAEGLELQVKGSGRAATVAELSALRRRPIAGGRVLVVSSNESDVAAIEEALAEDALVPLPVPDISAALTRSSELNPDLAIIDAPQPGGDIAVMVQQLRSVVGRENLPVVLLADGPDTDALHRGESPTDYLAKPFSSPMLRSRVRAWLARTLFPGEAESVGLGEVVVPQAVAESVVETPVGARADAEERYAGMLAALPLFRGLTREQLRTLVQDATEQIYPAGHVSIRQGEPSESLFVMLSGRVRVVEAMPEGQTEMLLGQLGQAEIFGELGILRDSPRSATVIAVERTHCLVLRQSNFLQVLRSSSDLAVELLRVLAERLYDADRRLARFAPDPLTGLLSRRAFHDQYRRLAAGVRRRRSGLLLLALDVFHLKTINDNFGYALGDEVLRTVADALMEATRATDLVARYGGDEFAVLLIEAGSKDIDRVTARVRDKLAELCRERRLPLTVGCSMGVAFSQFPPETADEFLREADRDMQQRRTEEQSPGLAS
ncbi:MAG: diguanylate cyclase [Candidatus Rokubacteria bacterium]|nr:diguanylate cyclase [Candidatus Rokubacteria bacterium]